jgi:hypothetical protein
MTGFFLDNSAKKLNYKIFYENSTGGSGGVTLGRTDGRRERQTLGR